MTTMDQIHHIRELFYQQGMNISEIASVTGFNWKTVKKYVDMEDFSSPPPAPEISRNSKLDPYKTLIDRWLAADKKAPRKQRHTARRAFNRLKNETADFNCSYRLVALYVSQKKEERALKNFATGRRNWLFAKSIRGAQASAAVYSITETAMLKLLPWSSSLPADRHSKLKK